MAQTNPVVGNFCLRYIAEFETVVRGHHVCKTTWSAVIGEALKRGWGLIRGNSVYQIKANFM